MEKMTYSKYDLIKAVLESNLEEGVKEVLINSWQPQPVVLYGDLTTNTDSAIGNSTFYRGD